MTPMLYTVVMDKCFLHILYFYKPFYWLVPIIIQHSVMLRQDIYCRKPKKKEEEQTTLRINQSVKKKWTGQKHDQSTFPNAQLCFPNVWSDWLIVKAQCKLASP